MKKTKQFDFIRATEKWKLLVASDSVVFSFFDDELSVLLVQRKFSPGVGQWALPGGFVREDESLEESARRELREETGLALDTYLEQLYTFGAVDRDPRGRVISVAYLALAAEPEKLSLLAQDDAAAVRWWRMKSLPKLSFGASHQEIIDYALQRLRWKLEYTNVAWALLPREFTLSQLQRLYEVVLGKTFDKRNFRKKILALNLVKSLHKKRSEAGRPAELYSISSRKLNYYQKIV